MAKNTLDYSIEAAYDGLVVGIDEVGRGPWVGPVVAAAALLNPSHIPAGICDSKKLSPAKREALFEQISTHARVAVGMATVEEIGTLNILGATLLAMRRAYDALGVNAAMALIDGNKAPALPCPTRCIVQGDAVCVSIAAASIIAKVTRDRMMAELDALYPYYGWATNAGYGTAQHEAGIAAHGLTVHHRPSYKPIRELLEAGTPVLAPREKPKSRVVSATGQLELI